MRSLKQRPKYWGNLVREFIYDYLDQDVAGWLYENKPPKITGKKYHQWLNEDHGVRKLLEHIYKAIGLAGAFPILNFIEISTFFTLWAVYIMTISVLKYLLYARIIIRKLLPEAIYCIFLFSRRHINYCYFNGIIYM